MVIDLDGLHGRAPGGGVVNDLLSGDALRQLLDGRQVVHTVVHGFGAPALGLLRVRHRDLLPVPAPGRAEGKSPEGLHVQAGIHLRAGGRVPVNQLLRGKFHRFLRSIARRVIPVLTLVLALVIADQIPGDVQGPRVQLDVGFHENPVGYVPPQGPLTVSVTVGQQQIVLSRLRMQQLRRVVILLVQRHGGPLAGGVPKSIVQAIDPQHLAVQLPIGPAGFAEPIVVYFRDRVRSDLDNGVFIGRIAAAMAGVEGDGRLQAGAVPADQAHPGPGTDDAPVLLFRLRQEDGGGHGAVLPEALRVAPPPQRRE